MTRDRKYLDAVRANPVAAATRWLDVAADPKRRYRIGIAWLGPDRKIQRDIWAPFVHDLKRLSDRPTTEA